MKVPNTQRRFSRILHWIGELTSRSSAALVTVVIVFAFGVLLAIAGFPPNWETAFSCAAAAVTLVMLFVIQHTSSRHQLSLQLKLDELIRTSPAADDQLVKIEIADDDELDELARSQLAHHEFIRDADNIDSDEFTHEAT